MAPDAGPWSVEWFGRNHGHCSALRLELVIAFSALLCLRRSILRQLGA